MYFDVSFTINLIIALISKKKHFIKLRKDEDKCLSILIQMVQIKIFCPPPINIDGVWKTPSSIKTNIDGTWRNVTTKKKFSIKFYSTDASLFKTLVCIEGQSIVLPNYGTDIGVGWSTQTYRGPTNAQYSAGNSIIPTSDMIFTEVYQSTTNAEYKNKQLRYTKTFQHNAVKSGYFTGKSSTGQAFTTQTSQPYAVYSYVAWSIDGGTAYLRAITLGPNHASRSVALPALTANTGIAEAQSNSTYEIILHAVIWTYYTSGIS